MDLWKWLLVIVYLILFGVLIEVVARADDSNIAISRSMEEEECYL